MVGINRNMETTEGNRNSNSNNSRTIREGHTEDSNNNNSKITNSNIMETSLPSSPSFR